MHVCISIKQPIETHSINDPFEAIPFPQSGGASPLNISCRSISLDQQMCSPLSFAQTLRVSTVWILAPLNASCIPFWRN